MTNPFLRNLGPSTFLTDAFGKVIITVTRHDTDATATLDALVWDPTSDTMDGPMEEEADMSRMRVLVSMAEASTDLGRGLEIQDAVTIGGDTYKVVAIAPDPTGIDSMTEVTVERLVRLTGYADGEDNAR